jgi:hypothetical protein
VVKLGVIKTGGGDGTVKSDVGGIDCGATCSADYAPGTTVTLTATPAPGWVFGGWQGACSGTGPCTVTMDVNRDVSAVFTEPPDAAKRLAVTLSGPGTGKVVVTTPAGSVECSSTCTHDFPGGTTVTLNASPGTASEFGGWSGDCLGFLTCTLTMNRVHSVTATFGNAPGTPKTLSVSRSGTGSGSVAIVYSGGFSDCLIAVCSRDFPNGMQVSLAATPSSGSTFVGWTGDCSGAGACRLTMDQNHAVAAVFALATATLTVTTTGSGSGTVLSSPPGIECGSTCVHDYTIGTGVTLTATAAPGSTFAGWGGPCSGLGGCTVALGSAQAVSATFERTPVAPPTTTPAPPAPVACVVPTVKGKTLAAAKRKISAGHCRTGNVTTAKSKTVAKGKVVSQRPSAGKRLQAGAKVSLVVSRGRR